MLGPVAWLRANLFNSWWSSAVTLVLLYVILRAAWGFIDWGLIHAIWTVPQGANGPDTASCRNNIGIGACWAVIGEKYRFMLFAFYPVRPAMAPGDRRAAVHRPVRGLRQPPVLAQGTGADLDRHPGGDRRADVGRHPGHAPRAAGPVGRTADHLDPGDLRPGLRLPAIDLRRARPALHQAAGGEDAVRRLCGTDPRRAADQPAVHGQRDVPAVPAGRHRHRQAAARPGGDHPVRRRLSCGSRARRPAIAAQGPGRSGGRARPQLLEEDHLHHPAAGAAHGDPAAW